jgi:hypothetical protein
MLSGAITPQEILVKSDSHRGLEGSFFVKAKTIAKNGDDIQEQEYDVKVLKNDVSLVVQTAPARAKGRSLLMRGLDMWLVTPDVKKPVRITLQQKLSGDISNGDISRTNYAQDYTVTKETLDAATNAHVLELKAKNNDVTYSRIKYWIEKSTYKPIKAEYYAISGKLLKTGVFSDYKNIAGKERMTRFSIADAVNKSQRSEIIYSGHKKSKFDESLFNKEQMTR